MNDQRSITLEDDPTFFAIAGGACAANVALYAGAILGNRACRAYAIASLVACSLCGIWAVSAIMCDKFLERKTASNQII